MLDISQSLLYKTLTGAGLSEDDLRKLSQAPKLKLLKKNEILLLEDKVCSSLWFIEKGSLRSFSLKDGLEINLAFNFENRFVTNLKSLRSAEASGLFIQALEVTVLYEFDKEDLFAMYKESSAIEAFGRRVIEQILVELEEQNNHFRLFSPAERYAYLQDKHPEILQRISLSQIASYLGVARETLSRIRKLK